MGEVNRQSRQVRGSRWPGGLEASDGWLCLYSGIARASRRRPPRGDRPAPAARVYRGHAIVIVRTGTPPAFVALTNALPWRLPCPGAYSTRAASRGHSFPIPYLFFVRKTALCIFFQIKRKKKHVKDGALATLLDRDGEPDGTLVGNLLWEKGPKIPIRARWKLVFISIHIVYYC
jgi:hypothetical protein